MDHQRTVIDHGLRVVTTTLPHTRSASISIFVGAGSRNEPESIAGISHFVEHMLFKGTEKRPTPKEISEEIEGVGGILNAATDKELTVYWSKVPAARFDLAMDVLCDNLLHSRLDSGDVEKEREVIIEELNSIFDSPADMANVMIDEIVWPDQPLGRDTAGTRESVSAITREDLIEYIRTQYLPANAVIAVAGQVTHEQVLESVRKHLDGWTREGKTLWVPASDGQDRARIKLKTKRTEQANLCIAVPGLPSEHPDRYAQDVMNNMLGEGMSSRLFLEIREKLSLAYDVHSYVNHFQDTGSMVVFAGVDTKKANQAIQAILAELGKLRDGVPEEELCRAKEAMKGRLLLRMEDTRAVSSWTGAQEILHNEIMTVDEVVAQVDAVTAEDIQRVAGYLFIPEKLNLSLVGPYRSEERFMNLLNF